MESLNECRLGTYNLWEGSIRSGKTYVSVLAFLMAVRNAPQNGSIAIVGRNLGSIYRNFFQTIDNSPLRVLKSSVRYRENAPTARIFGREVSVIGINDARAESKIRGMTIALVYVDEVTVIAQESFKQILNRMSNDDSRMFATTNPDSPAHWLKTDFIDRKSELPDWRIFHFVMDDNPALSEAVKERLSSQYRGLFFKRFILGLWVAAEGAIYDMWDEDRFVRPWKDLPPMHTLLGVGMDYGTNNPSTGILLGLSDERTPSGKPAHRLWAIDEWGYRHGEMQATLSPAKQAKLFKDWLAKQHLPVETTLRPRFIVVDPAANHFAASLQDIGIQTYPANNNVEYGIHEIMNLLSQGQLMVTDRCANLISEFPGYSWDDKKSKQGVDAPVKVADHWLDGLRYAVVTTEQYWRGRVSWPSL